MRGDVAIAYGLLWQCVNYANENPKVLKGTQKASLGRIKPWQLVDEDVLRAINRLKIISQLLECLKPRPDSGRTRVNTSQCCVEIQQLVLHAGILKTRKLKTYVTAQRLTDKECLAHPAAAIDNYQFSLIGFQIGQQLLPLTNTSYQFPITHSLYDFRTAKINEISRFSNF